MLSATLSCGAELKDVLDAFSTRDWDRIERYATHEAGGGKPTQDHYEAAIERWVNENDQRQAELKRVAPSDGQPTFDNADDLHEWAKKAWAAEDPNVGNKIDAYRAYHGLGEHAGAGYNGNYTGVGEHMGVSPDTVKNWIEGQKQTKTTKATTGIGPRLKEHELTHLFRKDEGRDDRPQAEEQRLGDEAKPEDAREFKSEDELRDENAKAEEGDHESTMTHDIVGDDEANPEAVTADANDANLNIQEGMHGKAETGAGQLDDRGRQMQRKLVEGLGDEAPLKDAWDKAMALMPKGKRVSWDELSRVKGGVQQGAGVKATFKAQGMRSQAAHNLASAWKEGVKFGQTVASAPLRAVPKEIRPEEVTREQIAANEKKYPALKHLPLGAVPGVGLRTLSGAMQRIVHAAVMHIESLPGAEGLVEAMRGVQAIGQFIPNDPHGWSESNHNKTGGFFNPATRSIALNGPWMERVAAYDGARSATRLLVHELVHAQDRRDGKWLSTDYDTSPTRAWWDGEEIHANPVMQEALQAYTSDPEKFRHLKYPLMPLLDGSGYEGEMHAATELGPRLAEEYITNPDFVRRELPLGAAHIERILKGTEDGSSAHSRGLEGVQGEEQGRADQGRPVQGEVQQDADAGGERVGSGLPREAGHVAEDEPHSPGPADSQPPAGGSGGGLTPPRGPSKVDDWNPNKGGFGRAVADLLKNKWRSMPSLLGFATTEQLAERFKELPPVRVFHETMMHMAARANALMEKSDETLATWRNLDKRNGDARANRFAQFLKDSTLGGIWGDRDLNDPANAHLLTVTVHDASGNEIHVAPPEIAAEHARLASEWKSLAGTGYQELFGRMQREFAQSHQAMYDAVRQRIVEAHYGEGVDKDFIDQAKDLKGRDARKTFLKDKTAIEKTQAKDLWSDLDEHHNDFANRTPGPYFPQSRFGEHVVSYKSKEHQQLEAKLAAAKSTLQSHLASPDHQRAERQAARVREMKAGARRFDKDTRADLQDRIDEEQAKLDAMTAHGDKLREAVHNAKEAVDVSKRNGDNYHAEFYERHSDAAARKAQLEQALGPDYEVKHQLKDTYDRTTDSVSPGYMRRLETALTNGSNPQEAAQVRATLRDMRLRMMPEHNILKNQLKRVGVQGARLDEAHRAYASHGIGTAWSLSRMEHQQRLQDAVSELRHGDDFDGKILGNELAMRVKQNLDKPKAGALIGAATNLTHMSYLGLSPAFLATVASHPFFIATPVIAARHGMRALSERPAAFKAAGQIIRLARQEKGSILHLHVTPEALVGKGIDANEASMLRSMIDNNRINTTQMADLYDASAGREKNYLDHAADMASTPAHVLEQTNRISTALVAYRLEREKLSKQGVRGQALHDAATAYADKIIGETHLNYTSSNRARFLHPNSWGGWGRVIFQFRSFQQGMLYLVGKNLVDATRGDKEAARAAAYLIGTQMATAGLTGLPGAAAAFAAANGIYNLFNASDDPKDLKQLLHNTLSDINPALGDAIVKGVPAAAGLDISERTGLGNIASPLPHVDNTKEGKDAVAANWLALTGGPFMGMIQNYAEAYKAARMGDYAKATQMALPAAAANVLKSVELSRHGVMDTRGNTLLDPSQLNAANIIAQAGGLKNTVQSDLQDQRAAYYDEKTARDDVRKELLRQYTTGTARGEEMDGLLERVQGFNERHPDDRITQGELIKARLAQQRAERMERSGIPVGRRDQDFAAARGL